MIADGFERRLISAATIAPRLQPGDTSVALSSFYPAQLVDIAGRVQRPVRANGRIHGRIDMLLGNQGDPATQKRLALPIRPRQKILKRMLCRGITLPRLADVPVPASDGPSVLLRGLRDRSLFISRVSGARVSGDFCSPCAVMRCMTCCLGPKAFRLPAIMTATRSTPASAVGRCVTTTTIPPRWRTAHDRVNQRIFALGIEIRVGLVQHDEERLSVERARKRQCAGAVRPTARLRRRRRGSRIPAAERRIISCAERRGPLR